jgi:hypothetical protein
MARHRRPPDPRLAIGHKVFVTTTLSSAFQIHGLGAHAPSRVAVGAPADQLLFNDNSSFVFSMGRATYTCRARRFD